MRRPKNAAERAALRPVYIPKDARCVLEHTNGSAWWSYELAGKLYGISFWGTSAKPQSHYRYSTEERRNEAIQRFRESVEHSLTFKQAQRAKKAEWVNPLKAGDILYTSWGYDQTNVEFFAVTRVSGKRVWVREIAADYEGTGFMSGNTWPAMPILFIGEETMHVAQPSGERGAYVKISDCRTAWLETGRVHNTTSYA
jgi:hypothetical protein